MSSLVETASAIVADARKVADRVDHPNRKYRHPRGTAALIIREGIGVQYSEETLRKSPCPYLIVQGRALYADEDLIALAQDILAHGRKGGKTPPDKSTAERGGSAGGRSNRDQDNASAIPRTRPAFKQSAAREASNEVPRRG